ncbi:MAG: hypothetical protein ACLP1X_26735 [Polyangiaceae bacterium]
MALRARIRAGDSSADAGAHGDDLHRRGADAIVGADGTRTVFVDVPQWDFSEQKTYVVDRDVAAGDGIETDCTWFNPTDNYVLPGPLTTDEMCGDGLIVWPGQTAAWKGPCQ